MKLFSENSLLKSVSTVCAASALLASQAVFAGSDAHSADSARDAATYTSQQGVDAQTEQSATLESTESATTSSENAISQSEQYEAQGQDSMEADPVEGVVSTTETWEADESLGFEQADANSDSRLDREELNASEQQLGSTGAQSFDDYDLNDDDYLDQNEYDSYSADLQANEQNRAASIEADE